LPRKYRQTPRWTKGRTAKGIPVRPLVEKILENTGILALFGLKGPLRYSFFTKGLSWIKSARFVHKTCIKCIFRRIKLRCVSSALLTAKNTVRPATQFRTLAERRDMRAAARAAEFERSGALTRTLAKG
jgi:hypothetical protein